MLRSEPSNGENKFAELEKTIKQCTLTEQAGGCTFVRGNKTFITLENLSFQAVTKKFLLIDLEQRVRPGVSYRVKHCDAFRSACTVGKSSRISRQVRVGFHYSPFFRSDEITVARHWFVLDVSFVQIL